MAHPVDDPLPPTVTAQAAGWLAASEGGALSREEEAALDAWLAADPRHARAFSEMTDIWALMDAVPETEALRASVGRSSPRAQRQWMPWGNMGGRPAVALAASAALIVLGISTDLPTRLRADEMTAVGERRMVTLPDGSTVHLDTQSALSFKFEHNRRVVQLLGGEAAFTVARDPRRPFVVEAGGGSVTALGTRFLIRKDAEGATVAVTQHSVRVAYPVPAGPTTIVFEGQGTSFGASGLRRASAVNTANAMAWTEGVLVFKDRPLAEVVAEIGRYHRGYAGVLGDARALRVSGVFQIGDPTAALDQLQRSLGLRSMRLTDRLIVLSN